MPFTFDRRFLSRLGCSAFITASAIGLMGFSVYQRQPSGRAPSEFPYVPPPHAAAAMVPPGYRAEIAVKDLKYPTSVEWDGIGNMFIAEAGYAYGDPVGDARVLKISPAGDISVLVGQLSGPVNDLLWYQGRLYISHRTKVSVVDGGALVDIVTGLPSLGDHHNNQLTVGPDGKIYIGQGTATNSGVVGLDNLKFLWLHMYPDVHDVSPYELCLTGEVFPSANPLFVYTKEDPPWAPHLLVLTSAFHKFGDTGGYSDCDNPRANGTVLRFNPDGSDLEVYAWGLRNPFSVMWSPQGVLWAADNGYDERGSRPIANAPDNIWCIKQNAWYGFPDYAGGEPVTLPKFCSERGPKPKFLVRDHPPVEQPFMRLPSHSATTKMDFSTSARFGYEGQMFLSRFGSGAPALGESGDQANPKVSRIDPLTGEMETFFSLDPAAFGPPGNEYTSTPGPRHPIEAKFSPGGDALYVVDFGAMMIIPTGIGYIPRPFPGTGVIWRVTRDGAAAPGPVNISANP